jgi:hypothetical protein
VSAELSRRGAWVMRELTLVNQTYLDFAFTLDAAENIEDLPDWAREALLNAEAIVGKSPFI